MAGRSQPVTTRHHAGPERGGCGLKVTRTSLFWGSAHDAMGFNFAKHFSSRRPSPASHGSHTPLGTPHSHEQLPLPFVQTILAGELLPRMLQDHPGRECVNEK